mgnify:CR=1 FL=1
MDPAETWQLGALTLDGHGKRLMRGGERIEADTQQVELLLHLVRAYPSIVGKDALPARQQLTLLCAELVGEAFLRQNAFSVVDRVCSPPRQAAMMKLLARFMTLAEAAQANGATPDTLAALPVMRALQRMGEDIGDAELPRFAELAARLEREFAPLLPAAATPTEAADAPDR